MKTSDEFRYDHDVLRAKLCLLELYLPSYRDCACTVSRLTDSLASCLRSHTEREERILAVLAFECGAPSKEFLEHLHDAHENQRMRLAILHELLTAPEPASEEQIAMHASYLVKDLREHMAVEERQLFPIIDRAGGDEVAAPADETSVELLGLA